MFKKVALYDIGFIVLLTSISHLLFSKYGFNPTDEGFVLSSTNRVLHGQIPHIDFSSVRPLGYAYLHIPELLISKTHFFLVSRFVFWLEQILIAFLWVRFLEKAMKQRLPLFYKYTTVLICFIFNVHYFPCSVLHTIDGLLMCMIGLNLIISEKKWNFIGFFFIGFAALCKQNYLVVLPFTLFLFGRKNIILNFITGLFPIIFYVVFVSIHGGWNDLIMQLTGHNELIKVGIFAYVLNPFFIIIFFLTLFLRYLTHYFIHRDINLAGIFKSIFAIFISISSILYLILLISNHYHGKLSFILLAIISAELFSVVIKKCKLFNFDEELTVHDYNTPATDYNYSIYSDNEISVAFVTLLLAWCVSISVGYNTPALFIGGCITWVMFHLNKYTFLNDLTVPKSHIIKQTIILAIYFIIFTCTRFLNIYRDSKITKLTYKLDNIVGGAAGIYTNKNTFAVLQELDSLKKSVPNLVAIPDFTVCNILHSSESKILTEWPNKTEIPNDKILEKIISKIKNDTTIIFAIPVFQTALLKNGFTLQENNGLNYPIIKFVKENYTKKTYTKYFELRSK